MRGKSSKQIKMRAKNRKDPSRKNEPIESNAIKYYFEHSVAPRIAMTELKNYDPSQTVAPKYADSQRLPECWREILRLPLKPIQERENRTSGFEPVTPVSASLPVLPTSEPGAKVLVACSKTNLPAFTVRMIYIIVVGYFYF